MKPDHKLLAEIERVEAECNKLIDKITDQERSPAIPWPCFRAMHVMRPGEDAIQAARRLLKAELDAMLRTNLGN